MLIVLLASCKLSSEKQLKNIAQLEEQINAQSSPQEIATLRDKYYTFVKDYPQDSLAPEMLFRVAILHLKIGHGDETIRDFDRLVNTYPNFEKNGEACFYKAFTYDNILHNLDSAKIAYEYFINHYPEDNLVTDAQLSLKYLGMSAEEIAATFNISDEDSLLEE